MQKREYVILSLIMIVAVFAVVGYLPTLLADGNSSGNNSNNSSNGLNNNSQACVTVADCGLGAARCVNGTCTQYDEHGCVPDGGYTWCEAKQKCLRGWEENCSISGDNHENNSAGSNEDKNNKTNTSRENNSDKAERMREAIKEKNKLGFNSSQIPANCTVDGRTLKCNINGSRTMVVFAGKSGNVIIQVKGVNASTQVQLYKDVNGTLYGVFNNNNTKLINVLPDEIRNLILEKTNATISNETNITLNSDGEYEYHADKEARFLGLFKVHEKVSWKVDAETGNLSNENAPWWGFLASDVKVQNNATNSSG